MCCSIEGPHGFPLSKGFQESSLRNMSLFMSFFASFSMRVRSSCAIGSRTPHLKYICTRKMCFRAELEIYFVVQINQWVNMSFFLSWRGLPLSVKKSVHSSSGKKRQRFRSGEIMFDSSFGFVVSARGTSVFGTSFRLRRFFRSQSLLEVCLCFASEIRWSSELSPCNAEFCCLFLQAAGGRIHNVCSSVVTRSWHCEAPVCTRSAAGNSSPKFCAVCR